MKTPTGRMGSAEPRLQNIPVRTELGRQIREAFLPKHQPITCDQCVAAMLQGVFCHEVGCVNEKKVWNGERWVDKNSDIFDELFSDFPFGRKDKP